MGTLEAAWAAKRSRTTCGRGHPIPPYSGFGTVRRCATCDNQTRAIREAAAKIGPVRLKVPRARTGAKTHCPSGHPYSGANLRIGYRGDKVCRACANAASAQWKVEKVERGEDPNRSKPKEKTIEKIAAAASRGMLLSEVRGKVKAVRPVASPNTLVNIRLWYPETWKVFSRQFKENKKLRLIANVHVVSPAIVPALKPRIFTDAEGGELVRRAYSLMSAHLSGDHRDDAADDMITAVLEGALELGDLNAKTAKRFINKQYSENHNRWGLMSLDQNRSPDGNWTLADTVTRGLWD